MTSSTESVAQAAFSGVQVLVTGGAGFIGSHLVDALLDLGARVRVLDNLSTGDEKNLHHARDRIEWLEADIRDLSACVQACNGAEIVFHQAALGSVPRSLEDPATTVAVNTAGSANLFAAARDASVRRVVYASSSSVYGSSEKLPKREGEEGKPLSPYALSKWMSEELAGQFASDFGMNFIGLRYFNIYGPRQTPHGPYAAVIPSFFKAHLGNRPPTIFGDGEQSRDFTAVRDAVRANLLAAVAPATADGAVYNVAAGRRTTINDLAGLIGEITESETAPVFAPPRAGNVLHSLADLSLAASRLGYQPRIGLREGLFECLDYYRGLFT